jgi:hypothetical protein
LVIIPKVINSLHLTPSPPGGEEREKREEIIEE